MSAAEARLRDRIAFLEEENRQFREALTEPVDLPSGLGLTAQQDAVLFCLMREPMASRKLLLAVLEAHGASLDGRDPKTLHVAVHKIRRKLQPIGVEIENIMRRGYRISPTDKAKLQSLTEPRGPSRRLAAQTEARP